jgi:hypothetical protein
MLELLQRIALETLGAFLTAAPYILLGLVVAGFMHRLLPQRLIERWMGRRGLSGAALASAIGVPLPVCSCGVVPIAVELRNKGASRPSTLGLPHHHAGVIAGLHRALVGIDGTDHGRRPAGGRLPDRDLGRNSVHRLRP